MPCIVVSIPRLLLTCDWLIFLRGMVVCLLRLFHGSVSVTWTKLHKPATISSSRNPRYVPEDSGLLRTLRAIRFSRVIRSSSLADVEGRHLELPKSRQSRPASENYRKIRCATVIQRSGLAIADPKVASGRSKSRWSSVMSPREGFPAEASPPAYFSASHPSRSWR